jgi:hypothetical protein
VTDIPRPADAVELEHMVEGFARVFLGDPLAHRYGRPGETQDGIDVVARDRRPGERGDLWAFQCKRTHAFRPKGLATELAKLAKSVHAPTHYVVVTTAPVSLRVEDAAIKASSGQRVVAVWSWDKFAVRAKEAGLGGWLPSEARRAHRVAYAKRLIQDFERAHVLYPRLAGPALHEVWVDVAPLLLHAPPRGVASVQHLEHWLSDPGVRRVALVGDMGSGKSVSLLRAAERLAQRILDGDDAQALPVRVRARDLRPPLGERPLAELLRQAEVPEALANDPGTDWRVWVDGLDELRDPGERERVLAALYRVSDELRVRGVAVSGRPASLGGLGPEAEWVRLELTAWSPTQSAELERRLGASPDRFQRVRAPLYTTVRALQEDPPHPSRGLEHLIRVAYEAWPKERGQGAEGLRQHRMGLEELALRCILQREPLEDLAVGVFTLAGFAGALDSAQSLGILVHEGGSLRFADAHVHAALASVALTRRSDDELRDIAARVEAKDILWLALDRLLEEQRERVVRLVFTEGVTFQRTVETQFGLLDAAIELIEGGRSDEGLVLWCVREACALTLNELAPWVRQAAGERVARLAALGGLAWTLIRGSLVEGFDRGGDRAAWFDALPASALSEDHWSLLMLEEVDVRVVAATKLGEHVESSSVQTVLLWALMDDGYDLQWGGPSIAAGRALRRVQGPGRQAVVDHAVPLLRWGAQFSAGGAALALRPGEAPVAELLNALRHLHLGCPTEPSIFAALQELRAQDEAAAWLAKHWPDAPEAQPRAQSPVLTQPQTEEPPPSSSVRRAIRLATAPGLVRDPAFASALLGDWSTELALCRAGYDHPDALVAVLSRPHLPSFGSEAQRLIGRAAVAHQSVAGALIDAWDQVRHPSRYPGLALEPLIQRDMKGRAAQIYAEWLPSFPFAQILASDRTTPARFVFDAPAIRAAAKLWCSDLWAYATEGRVGDDGRRTFLHELTLGSVLGAAAPAWFDEASIVEGLLNRARAGEGQWLEAAAALLALAAVRVRERWSTPSPWSAEEIPVLLHELRFRGAGGEVEDIARRVYDEHWAPGLVQAALLLADLNDDLVARSRELAEVWPRFSLGWRVLPQQCDAIVAAAPEAWAVRIEQVVGQGYLLGAGEILVAMEALARVPLAPAVEASVKRSLAAFERLPLLWVVRPGGGASVNTADYATRIRRRLEGRT